MLIPITSESELKHYEKKLRRLTRWVDRYQKPFWFFNSYPPNQRVIDEWYLITKSLERSLNR